MSNDLDSRKVTDEAIEEEEQIMVEVDGKEFETTKKITAENEIHVSIPPEIMAMGAEEIEKFKRNAESLLDAKGRTLKERMEWKREKEDRERKLRELDEQIAKKREAVTVAAKPDTTLVHVKSIKEMVAEELGVSEVDNDALRDFMDENPDKYLRIIEKRQDAVSERIAKEQETKVVKTWQRQSLQQKIQSAGYDVSAIERYRVENGFSSLDHAFRFFQKEHAPKTSPIDVINQAERIKRNKVTFIAPGDVASTKKSAMEQLNEMSSEELEKLSSEDPLILRAMEEINF